MSSHEAEAALEAEQDAEQQDPAESVEGQDTADPAARRRLRPLTDVELVGRVVTRDEMDAAYAGEIEPTIITVAAWKGGVGKSQLAYELAYLLGAVLVDFDWDRGGVTRKWGHRHEQFMRARLLDALETGTVPVPLSGNRKPDLVPSHPDFVANQPPPEAGADALQAWARAWRRPYVVVDTHPGGSSSTFAAMTAAHVIVVPAVLAVNEMEALEGMLEELPDYPLLLIPYMVPPVPPAAELEKLEQLVEKHRPQVGPPVAEHRWLKRRKIRIALCSYDPEPARVAPLAAQMRAAAQEVRAYG